jgi:hypothetical protein
MSLIARPSCATCAGVEFGGGVLHVRRVKNRTPSTHPLHHRVRSRPTQGHVDSNAAAESLRGTIAP